MHEKIAFSQNFIGCIVKLTSNLERSEIRHLQIQICVLFRDKPPFSLILQVCAAICILSRNFTSYYSVS